MKITVRLPTDIEVTRLRCVLPYDGEDYEEQSLADFPGRDGTEEKGTITLEIDLNTSRVVGWPEGRHATLHLKVRNEGAYTLIGADGQVVREHRGHIPIWLPNDANTLYATIYAAIGNYFIADIQGDGAIFQDGKPWKADAAKVTAWLDDLIDEDDGR